MMNDQVTTTPSPGKHRVMVKRRINNGSSSPAPSSSPSPSQPTPPKTKTVLVARRYTGTISSGVSLPAIGPSVSSPVPVPVPASPVHQQPLSPVVIKHKQESIQDEKDDDGTVYTLPQSMALAGERSTTSTTLAEWDVLGSMEEYVAQQRAHGINKPAWPPVPEEKESSAPICTTSYERPTTADTVDDTSDDITHTGSFSDHVAATAGDRSLARWEQVNKQWERTSKRIAQKIKKPKDQLVMSTSSAYRDKVESYDLLAASTPLHEKYPDEYWLMSLRGETTNFVNVGNEFSGLYCKITGGTSSVREKIIRQKSKNGDKTNSLGRTWKDSEYLKQRQKQLAPRIRELQSTVHIDDDSIDGDLTIIGTNIRDISRPTTAAKMDESNDEPVPETSPKSPKRSAQEQANKLAEQQQKSLRPPNFVDDDRSIYFTELITFHDGAYLEMNTTRLVMEKNDTGAPTTHINQHDIDTGVVTREMHVRNNGNVTITYEWTKQPQSLILENESTRAANADDLFHVNEIRGILLPGQYTTCIFTFTPTKPGVFLQPMRLITTPDLTNGKPLSLLLRGISHVIDTSRVARLQLEDHISSLISSSISHDVVESLVSSIPTPDPDLSQHRRIFYIQNRDLHLFYYKEKCEEMRILAHDVLACHKRQVRKTTKWDFSATTLRNWIETIPPHNAHARPTLLSRWESLVAACRIRPAPDATRYTICRAMLSDVTRNIHRYANEIRTNLGITQLLEADKRKIREEKKRLAAEEAAKNLPYYMRDTANRYGMTTSLSAAAQAELQRQQQEEAEQQRLADVAAAEERAIAEASYRQQLYDTIKQGLISHLSMFADMCGPEETDAPPTAAVTLQSIKQHMETITSEPTPNIIDDMDPTTLSQATRLNSFLSCVAHDEWRLGSHLRGTWWGNGIQVLPTSGVHHETPEEKGRREERERLARYGYTISKTAAEIDAETRVKRIPNDVDHESIVVMSAGPMFGMCVTTDGRVYAMLTNPDVINSNIEIKGKKGTRNSVIKTVDKKIEKKEEKKYDQKRSKSPTGSKKKNGRPSSAGKSDVKDVTTTVTTASHSTDLLDVGGAQPLAWVATAVALANNTLETPGGICTPILLPELCGYRIMHITCGSRYALCVTSQGELLSWEHETRKVTILHNVDLQHAWDIPIIPRGMGEGMFAAHTDITLPEAHIHGFQEAEAAKKPPPHAPIMSILCTSPLPPTALTRTQAIVEPIIILTTTTKESKKDRRISMKRRDSVTPRKTKEEKKEEKKEDKISDTPTLGVDDVTPSPSVPPSARRTPTRSKDRSRSKSREGTRPSSSGGHGEDETPEQRQERLDVAQRTADGMGWDGKRIVSVTMGGVQPYAIYTTNSINPAHVAAANATISAATTATTPSCSSSRRDRDRDEEQTEFTVVLTSDGCVYTRGDGRQGTLGHGDRNTRDTWTLVHALHPTCLRNEMGIISRVIQVVAGKGHVMALTDAGAVYTWGTNDYGQLGLSDKKARAVPTLIHQAVFQAPISTSTSSSKDKSQSPSRSGSRHGSRAASPHLLSSSSSSSLLIPDRVVQLVAGAHHSMARTRDGHVYTWGHAADGALGLGDGKDRDTPTLVPTFVILYQQQKTRVIDIAAAETHSLVLVSTPTSAPATTVASLTQDLSTISLENRDPPPTSGPSYTVQLYSFGLGSRGALGIDGWEDSNIPRPITAIEAVTIHSIAAGGDTSMCLFHRDLELTLQDHAIDPEPARILV